MVNLFWQGLATTRSDKRFALKHDKTWVDLLKPLEISFLFISLWYFQSLLQARVKKGNWQHNNAAFVYIFLALAFDF